MPKKWVAVILTLVLVCSLSAVACAAEYIESLAVHEGLTKSSAKSGLEKEFGDYINWDTTIIIDKDLNDGAGGRYIYMGYAGYVHPFVENPITGILFYQTDSEESPSQVLSTDKSTFQILGGRYEENGNINNSSDRHEITDLNDGAGGKYIYTYVTRDPAYGPALVEIGVGSKDHPYVIRNTDGEPQNLNAGCKKLGQSAPEIYLYAKPFDAPVYAKFYYLGANGELLTGDTSKQLHNHTDTMSQLPSVPTSVSYEGCTLTFKGWTASPRVCQAEPVSVAYSDNTTAQSPKQFFAVYDGTPTLTYNANGGISAPAAQTVTIFQINTSSTQSPKKNFNLSSTVPTHENPCYEFLGWSTDPNATQPQYTAGQSVSFDKDLTLYAVWQPHHYGTLIPAQPETHTKDTLNAGISAYYQCAKCMGYFTEAKEPATIFDLLGETPVHTFEDSVCTKCGYVLLITGTRSYVVTYDANGGTGAMEPQLFSNGVAQKLTANAFIRPGYTFIGWNTAADGSGTAYREDTNLTISRSITLYAQWQAIEGWVDPSTVNLPKTGDSSTPMLWLTMSILSMLGILLLRKKAYSR